MFKLLLIVFAFIGIGSSVYFFTSSNKLSLTVTEDNINVYFDGIDNEKIKNSFLKVVKQYEPLHKYDLYLVKQRIESSTMQAQPIFKLSALFGGVRSYQVKLGQYVRDSDRISVADLPEDVLTGWFAHELGHLVDYEDYSGIGMIWYGIKYLVSDSFKRKAEHRADTIAIEEGFDKEIIESKLYILENDFLDEKYQSQIKKYYMSIEDVRICAENVKRLGSFKKPIL